MDSKRKLWYQDMRSNIYSNCCTGCITELSNKYNCSFMSDTSSNKYSIYHLAGNSKFKLFTYTTLFRSQYRSTKCLWWKYNCDLYIYQQLCTDNNNMRSNICSSSCTGCITELSNKYSCRLMSDIGRNKYSIYQLAGNSKFKWWM